ncbi:MAG: dephospho-CoA kinase [Spirochaetaceae bacterium]|nr:dephospho-CoA kinase [Spirochaetaceae bacterium]
MRIIGLTGGYCAGKNEAANLLAERGWEIIDVDRLGHEALSLETERLTREFGSGILDGDGRINRKILGALVFRDAAAMRRLESIVHPRMLSLLDARLEAAEAAGTEQLCINAALLYRFPHLNRCEAVIEVKAPLYLRLQRAAGRDGASILHAISRIWSQRQLWTLRPRQTPRVWYVRNSGSLVELGEGLDRVLLHMTRSGDREHHS